MMIDNKVSAIITLFLTLSTFQWICWDIYAQAFEMTDSDLSQERVERIKSLVDEEKKQITRSSFQSVKFGNANAGGISNDSNNSQFNDKGINISNDQKEMDIEIKTSDAPRPVAIEIKKGVFINPCTGSISLDTSCNDDEESFPCLDATNIPSIFIQPSPIAQKIVEPIIPSMSPSRSISEQPTDLLSATPTISSLPTDSLSPTTSTLPTISLAPSEFVAPTSSPTQTKSITPSVLTYSPSSSSKPSQKRYIEKMLCPGEKVNCDSSNNDDSVMVRFKYSIETTNITTDVETVLPKLEETLLKVLAERLLKHCLIDSDVRKLTTLKLQMYLHRNKIGSRRSLNNNLKGGRRLHTIGGICSAPKDEENEGTCVPELDENNNCYVIDGGVTVSIDSDNDQEEVIKVVQNTTKGVMREDELLTDENPTVDKVKYWEEDEQSNDSDAIGEIDRANGEPPISVLIGASLAALATLLGIYLIRRNNASEGKPVKSVADVLLSPGLFISPNSNDLATHASCMDVHECKSVLCEKCYIDRKKCFIPSSPYPQNKC